VFIYMMVPATSVTNTPFDTLSRAAALMASVEMPVRAVPGGSTGEGEVPAWSIWRLLLCGRRFRPFRREDALVGAHDNPHETGIARGTEGSDRQVSG